MIPTSPVVSSSTTGAASASEASVALTVQPRLAAGRTLLVGGGPHTARAGLPVRWLAAGLLALAGVAGAAYWAGHASGAGTVAQASAQGPAGTQALPAGALPAPVYSPAAPEAAGPGPSAAAHTGPAGPAARPAAATPAAPACAQCGVVESVQAVQRPGQASGVGAVAGGVLGGVLGHQVGGGNGRTAMTVLGAVGGGLAGNEVEKRSKARTVYRVKMRTDSGALRTVELATAPAVGQRVRLDGSTLHPLQP